MPALGQWNELDVKQRAKLLATIKLLGDTGQCRNDERFKHERGKTYAIKARKARAYCFMTKDQRIVITHIAEKKQDKARGSDLDRAERIQVQCVNS
jgi:mRNA-degrading endonuclease RelE of RelBE toxin-antitoxin system